VEAKVMVLTEYIFMVVAADLVYLAFLLLVHGIKRVVGLEHRRVVSGFWFGKWEKNILPVTRKLLGGGERGDDPIILVSQEF
jgi:hypothetical protein